MTAVTIKISQHTLRHNVYRFDRGIAEVWIARILMSSQELVFLKIFHGLCSTFVLLLKAENIV